MSEERQAYYVQRFGNISDNVTAFTKTNNAAVEFYHLLSGQRAMFKSFITTFNDDHQSEWSEESLYGRMDNTAAFKRTSRKITLEFDVPSFSEDEALLNFKEMAKLKRFLYPGYSKPGGGYIQADYAGKTSIAGNSLGLASAPLMRVRLLNYITTNLTEDGLLCSVSNIAFSPNQDAGEYILTNIDNQKIIVPKLFKINLSLSIYHEHKVGWVKNDDGKYVFGDSDKIDSEYPYKKMDIDGETPQDDNPSELPEPTAGSADAAAAAARTATVTQ